MASIYDRLLGTNYSKENLYAAWDAEYPDTSYLYLRLLSIAERVLAPSEPTFLLLLLGLAKYYVAEQNYCAAEPLYARALAIVDKAGLTDDLDTDTLRDEYTRLLEKLDRPLEIALSKQ